jgi:hypothetical protein
MARMWLGLLLALGLLLPAVEARGVKRAARPKTAVKKVRSKPPVFKAPKQKKTKWRPAETKPESKYKRSKKARAEFQRVNPCPATGKTTGRCPGYVVDHIRPLKRGGPDVPANMQWQTEEAAKLKDRIE